MLSLRASLREFCCVKFITAKIYGHVCFLTAFRFRRSASGSGTERSPRARGLAPVLAVLRGAGRGPGRDREEFGEKITKKRCGPREREVISISNIQIFSATNRLRGGRELRPSGGVSV